MMTMTEATHFLKLRCDAQRLGRARYPEALSESGRARAHSVSKNLHLYQAIHPRTPRISFAMNLFRLQAQSYADGARKSSSGQLNGTFSHPVDITPRIWDDPRRSDPVIRPCVDVTMHRLALFRAGSDSIALEIISPTSPPARAPRNGSLRGPATPALCGRHWARWGAAGLACAPRKGRRAHLARVIL